MKKKYRVLYTSTVASKSQKICFVIIQSLAGPGKLIGTSLVLLLMRPFGDQLNFAREPRKPIKRDLVNIECFSKWIDRFSDT